MPFARPLPLAENAARKDDLCTAIYYFRDCHLGFLRRGGRRLRKPVLASPILRRVPLSSSDTKASSSIAAAMPGRPIIAVQPFAASRRLRTSCSVPSRTINVSEACRNDLSGDCRVPVDRLR